MNDIKNKKDIERLVNTFYEKVKTDEVIGYFFTEVMQVKWEKHLPTMYDFWENILFHKGTYSGNPMQRHQAVHQQSPLTAIHFEHWVALFTKTVDELFEGDNANIIKNRATSIATVLRLKIVG